MRTAIAATLIAILCHTSAVAQGFSFSGIVFSYSAYLAESELAAVADRYTGRQITFQDVQTLMDEVQGLYAQRGIVTAQVLLEPQEVRVGGVLELTLVEARTDKVTLADQGAFKRRLIDAHLPLPVGKPPDYDAIAEKVRFFEVAYGAQLGIEFAPGTAEGSADALVRIDPLGPQVTRSFGADNRALETLGGYQASAGVAMTDRMGRLETVSGQLSANRGGASLSGELSLPVGVNGTRASLTAEAARGRIVAGPLSGIAPESDRWAIGAGLSRPFAIRPDRHSAISAEVSREQSKNRIAGVDGGRVDVTEIALTGSHTRRFARAAVQADMTVAFGTSESASGQSTDGRYWRIAAELSYARRMTDNLTLEALASAQYAPEQNLPGLRQISAGGASHLVGYPDFIASGDSGATTRLRLLCQTGCGLPQIGAASLRPFAFLDAGYILPYAPEGGTDPGASVLSSLGLGSTINFEKITITAQVGIPLTSTDDFDADGEVKGYVGLAFTF